MKKLGSDTGLATQWGSPTDTGLQSLSLILDKVSSEAESTLFETFF